MNSPGPLEPLTSRFLAFDTSTEGLSVAVTNGSRVWQHDGPGAAQASASLIPAILQLLADAGLSLATMDAVVFGRGPGAFTGLRTACAVAQGLALGAGLRVLPVDTLLAVAEAARFLQLANLPADSPAEETWVVTALLDARMDEVYMQRYAFAQGEWQPLTACVLIRPEQLQWTDLAPLADAGLQASPRFLVAGNAFASYPMRLPALPVGWQRVDAQPSAAALLRLAPALMQRGQAVEAAQALPLYIRDKVALTTEERAQAKAAAAPVASPPRP